MIYKDETEATAIIKTLTADVRLDYHGVLDTLPTEPFLEKSVCVICFVGRQSQTRKDARQDIQARIATGQIMFGILVFKRGSTKPGTKAWVNSLLQATLPNPLFIDDSEDHIDTTKTLCPHIRCVHHITTNPAVILRCISDCRAAKH